MRLIFWKAPKGYEEALAPALIAGAAAHGDEIIVRPIEEYRGPEADGGIICGVVKREILWDHQRAGRLLIYMDKGYLRTRAPWRGINMPAWWRMCLGDTHATRYLQQQHRPLDRLRRDGPALAQRRSNPCGPVIIAGSSAKFHETMRLPHPTAWAAALVEQIRAKTAAPIIYRPKPSWQGAEPVPGAIFDHGRKTQLSDQLAQAQCVVTHGSIASVDAIAAGVPCIVLGNAPAAPISSRSIDEINSPRWEPEIGRLQWAANLAYTHFRPDEIAEGLAWRIIKEQASALTAI